MQFGDDGDKILGVGAHVRPSQQSVKRIGGNAIHAISYSHHIARPGRMHCEGEPDSSETSGSGCRNVPFGCGRIGRTPPNGRALLFVSHGRLAVLRMRCRQSTRQRRAPAAGRLPFRISILPPQPPASILPVRSRLDAATQDYGGHKPPCPSSDPLNGSVAVQLR
jgi:hypothetical protein